MPDLKPAKILFVELIGRGEFLWNLPLAQALHRRGHSVQFLTLRENEADCRKAGIAFHEWVMPSLPAMTQAGDGDRGSHGHWIRQGVERWRTRAKIQTAMIPGLYQFIEREERGQSLLVAARHNALGARLAHEKLGVPLVGLYPTPAPLRTCYHEPGLPISAGNDWVRRSARATAWFGVDLVADYFLLPEFNRHRRRLGLQAIRRPFHRWVESPGLNVGLFPECFAPRQPDWPANLVLAGFPLDGKGEAIPPALSRFLDAGEAPVVFTRGSHPEMAAQFFLKAVDVCTRLGVRGVLAGSAPGLDVSRLPPTVMAAGFVPFRALLPRAAAIVHHGGIGTTAHALAAGIPQVVTPMFDDQFYNARRIRQLGAGSLLGPSAWSAKDIADALSEQLNSCQTRELCQALARQVRQESDLSAACDEIEIYWQRALTV